MTDRQADEPGAMAPTDASDAVGRGLGVEVTPRQLGGIAVVAILVLGGIGLLRRRRGRPDPGPPTAGPSDREPQA
jgi:hypothetical protein